MQGSQFHNGSYGFYDMCVNTCPENFDWILVHLAYNHLQFVSNTGLVGTDRVVKFQGHITIVVGKFDVDIYQRILNVFRWQYATRSILKSVRYRQKVKNNFFDVLFKHGIKLFTVCYRWFKIFRMESCWNLVTSPSANFSNTCTNRSTNPHLSNSRAQSCDDFW